MSWKDIIKEDLTEKVIQALIHFYGSREEVISSNTLGTMYEENLKDLSPMDKDDVKDLIEDNEFAATSHGDLEDKGYLKMQEALKKLL